MDSKNLSVSIVIPNYNGKNLLAKNLPFVFEAAAGCEVIVVDDASTDDSVQWLKKTYPDVKLVTHEVNHRFAAACNSGIAAATSEIVILLNTDVIPTDDFLTPLQAAFTDDKVFAVGCAEKEAKDTDWISGKGCCAFQRGFLTHWRCDDQVGGNSFWASGGSGAFRKSIWSELGGMDILFAPAYEEDRDICYRALKRGYKVLFEPSSVVIHKHETTNTRELGTDRMMVSSYKNQFLIVWKNITSTQMLFSHLLWLPYQLCINGLRSRGMLIRGFFAAVKQLPAILPKRAVEKEQEVITDKSLLKDV